MGQLGDLSRLLVTDVWIQGGYEHERVVQIPGNRLFVRLDSLCAVPVKREHGIAKQPAGLQEAVDQHRLEDIELKMPLARRYPDRHVVAEHLADHHGHRLALRRIHLAGHDRAAWLVLGNPQLADAAAGPARQQAHVIRDLHQIACKRLQ
ncbi:hypothetical protein D3C75_889200 [compost metagenome]